MGTLRRGLVVTGVAGIVCTLHASIARSDELCDALEGGAVVALDPPPAPARACPADMVEIEDDFCPFLDQVCLKRPPERSYRCSLYAKSSKCQTATKRQHFCIDVYEWPNEAGAMPVVMKDWYQAKAACEGVGKRLCTEDEWTQACEGPERLPYPYGYARDATACNIDKPHPDVDEKAINDPKRRDAEVARLWQGEASGARERCVSPYGVHDMTGNVDEWVVNPRGKPHQSALKGGYWSYVRGRCRAVTEGHEEGFRYYQIGWRCCADPKPGAAKSDPATQVAAPPPPPSSAPAPAQETDRGTLDIPARAAGHRVFIDGSVVATTPGAVIVDCGSHVVKIGHDGREQTIDVPCGGRVAVEYP